MLGTRGMMSEWKAECDKDNGTHGVGSPPMLHAGTLSSPRPRNQNTKIISGSGLPRVLLSAPGYLGPQVQSSLSGPRTRSISRVRPVETGLIRPWEAVLEIHTYMATYVLYCQLIDASLEHSIWACLVSSRFSYIVALPGVDGRLNGNFQEQIILFSVTPSNGIGIGEGH